MATLISDENLIFFLTICILLAKNVISHLARPVNTVTAKIVPFKKLTFYLMSYS